MTDYMKEAERLLGEYADARVDFLSNGTPGDIEARAALLAHIQRGAVPEGWQVVPKEPTPDMKAAPANDRPGFSHLVAREVYCSMLAAAPDHFRDAAADAPAPAEVPTPEPVAYLYTLEYGETVAGRRLSEHQLNYPFGVCGSDYLAQTDDGVSYVRQIPLYTKDAEAAGYARGLKEADKLMQALRDIADPIAALERDLRPGYALDGTACVRMADNPETYRRMAREAIAAMLGEVKP